MICNFQKLNSCLTNSSLLILKCSATRERIEDKVPIRNGS